MSILISYMEQLTNVQYGKKYYMTAEKGESSVWHRKSFYEQLNGLGFEIDIRKFKGKRVECPEENCPRSKTGFNI